MKTAEAVREFMHLDRNKGGEVKDALIEACINAFENSSSDVGRADINFDSKDDGLPIAISDDGYVSISP